MDNPSGTTEQQPVDLADRMYGSPADEPETDSVEEAEADTVDETEESDGDVVDETTEKTADDVEEDADESDDSEAEPEDSFTVPGEEKPVNRQALIDGYLRQSDYTKKTQALAEDRRVFGEKLQVLSDIENELGQLIMGEFAQIDWASVRDSDPSQYLALKEAKEAREKTLADLKAKRDQLISERANAEATKLHEVLNWSDPAKRDSDIQLISKGVKEAGVPDDVFASVTNHALMLLVMDGIKHRKLQETKPEIVRKVKAAPKVTSKPVKQAQTQELSLADRMYGRKKA